MSIDNSAGSDPRAFDNARSALEGHLTRALQALETLAGGRSMCAIGRSGQSFPAAKYHEGAVTALSDLRRDIRRRGRQGETADVTGLARSAAERWRGRTTSSVTAGSDWCAYLAGGVDALERLIGELTGA